MSYPAVYGPAPRLPGSSFNCAVVIRVGGGVGGGGGDVTESVVIITLARCQQVCAGRSQDQGQPHPTQARSADSTSSYSHPAQVS